MTESPPTVAHALVASLRAAGVRRIHGVPGEDHLRLLHAIEEGGLAYVAARDESAAGAMAAAEAQATGVPGVLLVTPAPGITNALNGIASAAMDHTPLLVIVGQHPPERRPVIVRQNLDNHALVAPLAKWSTTLSPRVHQVMAKALDTALLGDPGVVLVELRDDVARAEPVDRAEDWPVHAPLGPVVARAGTAAPLREALAAAGRPVVIVGGRGRAGAVGAAVEALAAAVRAPVFTTPSAKGSVPAASPWLAGTFLNGNLEDGILGRADLAVGVGLDAGDVFNGPWRHRVPFIALEPDPARIQHFFPTTDLLVGELACLIEDGTPATSASTWSEDEVARYRADLLALFGLDDPALTVPSGIVDARSVLPDDTLVTVDAGFGKPLMSLLWDARVPEAYVSSQGLSTMGYAIPAANALKLVDPSRPVVGFLGDGSLLMRASEIGVAAAHGIAPIYVVWVDGSLSQIEVKQRRQDLREVGVRFDAPSCAAIATAFGGAGCDVTTREEFRDAIAAGLRSTVPTLIGARVDQARRGEWFELLRG